MKKPEIFNIQEIDLQNGQLYVLEKDLHFTFEVSRMYWLSGSDQSIRGDNANKINERIYLCQQGSIELSLEDQLHQHEVFILDKPTIAVYCPNMYWIKAKILQPDTILMCLNSAKYDPSDIIAQPEEFFK